MKKRFHRQKATTATDESLWETRALRFLSLTRALSSLLVAFLARRGLDDLKLDRKAMVSNPSPPRPSEGCGQIAERSGSEAAVHCQHLAGDVV